jgi:O-antigen ligase
MLNTASENVLVKYLYVGSFLTTIFVISNIVTDPVNVTKHFLLGATAFGAVAAGGLKTLKLSWTSSKIYLVFTLLFIVFMVNAVINSSSPLAQNLYGTYGRNTGFIAYLSLSILTIAATVIRQKTNFEKLIYGLFAAGFANVFYCLWAWNFGDFIGWSNVYNTILGTFGNPNFIGAFLGIFVSVLFAYVVAPKTNNIFRLISVITILIGFAEIKHSHAVQGIAVTAAGFSLVIFYLLRHQFKNWFVPTCYSIVVALIGFVALMGALQKGPLASYIYKTSVSLRGEYWQAGINMAKKFPMTGVGMDSYGDWFRRLRDDSALIMPGPNTVTNAAHNVNIDLLAYGGFPLFICYMALLVITLIAIIRVTLRSKKYDVIFVALATGWICYQIQAAISINQIGLAIWGWLFGGAIIAYEISTRDTEVQMRQNSEKTPQIKKNKVNQVEVFSPQLLGGIGMVIGMLIAVPPLSADMAWSSALKNSSIESATRSLEPGYLRPSSSYRISMGAYLFEQNKLYDLAYKYAKASVKFNPQNFDSWKMLYYATNTPKSEKDFALAQMKLLDPKNPDVLSGPK